MWSNSYNQLVFSTSSDLYALLGSTPRARHMQYIFRNGSIVNFYINRLAEWRIMRYKYICFASMEVPRSTFQGSNVRDAGFEPESAVSAA